MNPSEKKKVFGKYNQMPHIYIVSNVIVIWSHHCCWGKTLLLCLSRQ